MALEHLIILALIQGLTEFWPVSSSGHLVLLPQLAGWQDQGQLIDVALHVGSLLAVLIYFRKEVVGLIRGCGALATGHWTREARLLVLLIIATVPFVVAGAALVLSGSYDGYSKAVRSLEVVAWANVVFAILLWVVDQWRPDDAAIPSLGFASAFIVGIAQVFAIVPGASRSGVTMTAGRLFGLERTEAARFSMLMSIPAILASGAGAALKLYKEGEATVQADAIIAAGLSFFAALAAIWFMMALLRHMTMLPFVLYRLGLGAFLFYLAYA